MVALYVVDAQQVADVRGTGQAVARDGQGHGAVRVVAGRGQGHGRVHELHERRYSKPYEHVTVLEREASLRR